MKRFILLASIVLSGCSPGLTEQRVEQDFRNLLAKDYKAINAEGTQRIAFGDGWDDGAEVRVYFKAKCRVEAVVDECQSGALQMQMSYQKNSAGNWEVLSARVVAAE